MQTPILATMNTSADYHEHNLQIETQHRKEHKMESSKSISRFFDNDDDDDDEPSPTMATEDSSSSSLTDCSSLYSCNESDCYSAASEVTVLQRRRLHFNDKVEVREYAVTVGEHPFCDDALPLQLDWQYAAAVYRHIDCSKNRGFYYQAPPRLSLVMRRRRLKEVSNFTDAALDGILSDDDDDDDLMLMKTCHRSLVSLIKKLRHFSWIKFLPVLDLSDPVTEDEEDFFAHDAAYEQPTQNEAGAASEEPPQVIHWERNRSIRRLQSFNV